MRVPVLSYSLHLPCTSPSRALGEVNVYKAAPPGLSTLYPNQSTALELSLMHECLV